MSSVIANVVEIESIQPHPNADRLFLARIKGWQAVIRKREDGSPEFAPGERVVFIPPDSTLPREMAERLGVLNYLSERTNVEGGRDLVVRQVRLRGEPSFGLLVRPDDPNWPVGTDVREHYGIGKFRPPVRFSAGDSEPNHPLFQRYTEIENLRNFPDVLAPDTVFLEKAGKLRIFGCGNGESASALLGVHHELPPQNRADPPGRYDVLILGGVALREPTGDL